MLLGCTCIYSAGDPQQIRRFVPERITASPEASIRDPSRIVNYQPNLYYRTLLKNQGSVFMDTALVFFTAFKYALNGKPRHPKEP
jgi:hypothetical protein